MSDNTVQIRLEPHEFQFILGAVFQEVSMDWQDEVRASNPHTAGSQSITEATLMADFSTQIYDLLKTATEVILVVPEDAA